MFNLKNIGTAFLLAATGSYAAIYTSGDFDNGGPGIIIENRGASSGSYYFYSGAGNFNNPYKYVSNVQPGQEAFVSMPVPWQGYIQRGADHLNLQGQVNMPMTMVEFQLGASDGTGGHGDISLEQGHDGAATICSTTTRMCGGFTRDILCGAPEAALRAKPDGSKALDTTMGNWVGRPNGATIAWEQAHISQTEAYIVGGSGTHDIASSNNRFKVTFY